MIQTNCYQIELITGMKLVTDLSQEFTQIQFMNKLGYIIIDYERNAVLSLGHKMNDVELNLVQDVMMYLDWLSTGEIIKNRSPNNVTKM